MRSDELNKIGTLFPRYVVANVTETGYYFQDEDTRRFYRTYNIIFKEADIETYTSHSSDKHERQSFGLPKQLVAFINRKVQVHSQRHTY